MQNPFFLIAQCVPVCYNEAEREVSMVSNSDKPKKGKRLKILLAAVLVLALAAAGVAAAVKTDRLPNMITGSGKMTVGKHIKSDDITEFYYTYSTSTNPPVYQRYRFYSEDGRWWFYHEAREGDHWPLTEADITDSGTKELTQEEREAFFACLNGGAVEKRKESLASGDAGPWLYLYWNGDRGKYQEFTFATYAAQQAFEELCVSLKTAP